MVDSITLDKTDFDSDGWENYGSLCVGDFNHAANREDRIPNPIWLPPSGEGSRNETYLCA
jgi:hypothetical protein